MGTSGKKQPKAKWTTMHPMVLGNLLTYLLEQNALVLDGFFVLSAMQMALLNATKLVSSQKATVRALASITLSHLSICGHLDNYCASGFKQSSSPFCRHFACIP